MDRTEVLGFVRAAIFETLITMEGNTTGVDISNKLAEAVVARLEAVKAAEEWVRSGLLTKEQDGSGNHESNDQPHEPAAGPDDLREASGREPQYPDPPREGQDGE